MVKFNSSPIAIHLSENIALNKPAIQSSTHAGHEASRAVDGDTKSRGYCSHTQGGDFTYWYVDLQEKFAVGIIQIWTQINESNAVSAR